ncbi:MAG TPA: translation initiation factor IF-2 [Candidatus Moranbacteria bacterium]|nr:translation initiation factor IF-2 [Candidatus Moranbacteria bacterium]
MAKKSEQKKTIKVPFQVTVGDLAKKLDLGVAEVIKQLMTDGIIAGINDVIDFETATIISNEMGFETELDQSTTQEVLTLEKLDEILKLEKENQTNLESRPPVVTILGHVDHGKTTLLDTLKKTHVAEREAGGITQHINAYQVKFKNRLITFIDTPGHEAFQTMRERGASLADIAILVVAADDGVKPQTAEVIKFVLEKNIPTVVAINKIDKPAANINKVKQELAENGLLVEGYGGKIPVNEISAKQNTGIEGLLETILLMADVEDFKSDPCRAALGVVLEAHKDPQKGPVATVLIKTGTLIKGEDVLVGDIFGRARNLEDYTGRSVNEAPSSSPVTIIGLPTVPQTNDVLQAQSENCDKKKRKLLSQLKVHGPSKIGAISSKQMIANIDEALSNKLSIVLKADVQGSLEAVQQILHTIDSDEIKLNIFSTGIGDVTERDLQVAQTGQAIVYGFNVLPTSVASRMATEMGVPIKTFSIIYELVESVKNDMSALLPPEIKRTDLGRLKVLAIFKNMKKGMVVGGKVMNGKIVKGENLEILRDKEAVGKGKLVQLQHNKEETSEVKEGLECGLSFEGKDKIAVGDTLVCYKEEEIKRKV